MENCELLRKTRDRHFQEWRSKRIGRESDCHRFVAYVIRDMLLVMNDSSVPSLGNMGICRVTPTVVAVIATRMTMVIGRGFVVFA
jgi:hypothetical protein